MSAYGENAATKIVSYTPDNDLTIELSWHAVTDIGLRRETNEDSLSVVAPIFAVADGMGGHAAGDVASAAVAYRLAEASQRLPVTRSDLNLALCRAVDDITEAVGEAEQGAGTTVSGIMFGTEADAPVWEVFNIGDSRVYQFFRGALTKVTVDHSIVQHLVDTGAITEEEAESHPHANVITRAVGFNEDPIPDYVQLALIPGQRMLICSDGLTKELTDVGIRHFLAECETAEEAAKELVAQALGNSGRDNVTAIVVDVLAVGELRDIIESTVTPEDTQEVASLNPNY